MTVLSLVDSSSRMWNVLIHFDVFILLPFIPVIISPKIKWVFVLFAMLCFTQISTFCLRTLTLQLHMFSGNENINVWLATAYLYCT